MTGVLLLALLFPISGRVIDMCEDPIAHVTVKLRPIPSRDRKGAVADVIATAETNQNGTFTFYGITAGKFELDFEKPGFSPSSTTNTTPPKNMPPTVLQGPYLILCASSSVIPYYVAPIPDSLPNRTSRP
jgi:hypothetical protein